MERAKAVEAAGEARKMLRSALRRPSRLLALGWDDVPAALADEIVADENGNDTFGGVLWAAAGTPEPAAVAAVRARLTDKGRLVVHAGADAEARSLVRLLSESGFVVVKELLPEEVGRSGGAVVVARRDDFVMRSYEERDFEPIVELFPRRFHVPRGPEHWRWKYHENPWGNRYISLAYSRDGELAVHYAGFPVPFRRDGEDFLALQMGDTMTAEAYQHVGRGTSSLLARTVRHFFSIYRQGPFRFFYGFNTGGIQRFCLWFIGGSQAEPAPYRRLELAHRPPSSVDGYRVERITRPGGAFDRFFERVAGHYGFLVRRDARWLDWRYLRCPDGEPYVILAAYRFRRLVGWSVFRMRKGKLAWGDALYHPRHVHAAEAALAGALEQEEFAGQEAVEGWFSARPSWWHTELRRLGFEAFPEPDGLGMVYLPDRDEDPALERLYYTMGDGDLF